MCHRFARIFTSPHTASLHWILTSCSAFAPNTCRVILEKNCGDADFHHCSISSVPRFWVREPFPSLLLSSGTQVLSEIVEHQCFTGSETSPVHLQLRENSHSSRWKESTGDGTAFPRLPSSIQILVSPGGGSQELMPELLFHHNT